MATEPDTTTVRVAAEARVVEHVNGYHVHWTGVDDGTGFGLLLERARNTVRAATYYLNGEQDDPAWTDVERLDAVVGILRELAAATSWLVDPPPLWTVTEADGWYRVGTVEPDGPVHLFRDSTVATAVADVLNRFPVASLQQEEGTTDDNEP